MTIKKRQQCVFQTSLSQTQDVISCMLHKVLTSSISSFFPLFYSRGRINKECLQSQLPYFLKSTNLFGSELLSIDVVVID
jgi:hypothetical protein